MTNNHDVCEGNHGGADTSVQAHNRIRPTKSKQRAVVLEFIRSRGIYGATSEEIHAQLDIRYTAASARMSELKRDKLIVDSGRRRKTSTGSPARVMVLPGQLEMF